MPEPESPWFAGRPGRVLAYRVNRRPLPQESFLAPEGMPPDVLDHFVRVLTPGYEVVTGHRDQRVWRVGGVRVDRAEQLVLGRLGWEPRGAGVVVSRWSAEEKDWTTGLADPLGGEVMPFVFDAETRLLAVLRAPKSDPRTIGVVFTRVLDENERQLIDRTVEWAVEPILDRATFLAWLGTLDVVRRVSFTAKLPNPDPTSAFEDLYTRMERRRATVHTETMRSEREEGLQHPEEDPDFRQAIAMGEHGFAELSGEGRRGESVSKFSQRNTVATEHVPEVPETWPAAWALIKGLVKGSLRRFLRDEAA